ncbi:MAG: hypothetical protein R3C59_12815 [Planctomycetaceae bacterium]
MRQKLVSVIAASLLLLAFASADAEAAGRFRNARVVRPAAGGGVFRGQQPGFFGNLMEVERRKNAWLRSTFFGG